MIIKLRNTYSAIVLACGLALAAPSQAALLTTQSGYTGPALDLSAYANGQYNFTFGPVSIPGGITFTSNVINSNSGNGSVLGQGGYGLAANGSFSLPAVYAGLDGANGYMSFNFNSAVSSFGAFLNYAPGYGNPIIGAYDSLGILIEQWDLGISAPISTPNGVNAFDFRGISLTSATMTEFRMSNSYMLAAATSNGAPVDPNPIPEPASLALVAIALAGMGLARRRVTKAV